MITVYRIVDERFASDAFTGNGAKVFPGRWNHKGTRMVYTSESLSLCALELFVHLRDDGRAKKYVSIAAVIPADRMIQSVSAASLPSSWGDDPPSRDTRDIGDAWVQVARTPVLKVPSTVTFGEYNFLLNPAHPEFGRIQIAPPTPFKYDPRLWKRPHP